MRDDFALILAQHKHQLLLDSVEMAPSLATIGDVENRP
jgi:hypothetical protein